MGDNDVTLGDRFIAQQRH